MRIRAVSAGLLAAALFVVAPVASPAAELGVSGASEAGNVAPEVPVLATELARGGYQVVRSATPSPPSAKTIDGDPSDWTGVAAGYGGTLVHSRGEVVYQDHLFDARGADDGLDAERRPFFDATQELAPRTYRVEALVGQDAPSQVGFSSPGPLRGEEHYGDAGLVDVADLVEVRLAPGSNDGVAFLARTTTMETGDEAALLVLVDTAPGDDRRVVPFESGLTTGRADVAILLAGASAWRADLVTGAVSELPAGTVVVNPSGWTNTVEAELSARALGLTGAGANPRQFSVAVASGRHDGAGGFAPLEGPDGDVLASAVANIAFRAGDVAEPVRTWFELDQALSLFDGSVDPYFTEVSLPALRRGVDEHLVPTPGYHDRIFASSETISDERAAEGVWQHYGLYLPDGWTADDPGLFPLQWWLHWRGGHAHSAAAVIPRMFETLGDGLDAGPLESGIADSVVVAPRGRGTSRWYVGVGHVDVLEVWDDVFALVGERLDDRRVYVTGHSMGGWGSYLLPILYPDRFAAAVPYAGPVTQGAWTGVDVPGCDGFQWEEYTPCYIEANGSRPRDQHTRRLLDNLLHVPVAVMQGAADELVPVSGVTRQVERLHELGYRHRYYLFPTYEHFSHPVVDEWAEGGRYAHRFVIPDMPRDVVYVRDRAFEEATESVQSAGVPLDFAFDSAYWMSGLAYAPGADQARFSGTSLAVPEASTLAVPEAGGPSAPGQHGPYVMSGRAWLDHPLVPGPALANGFEIEVAGASAVTLDLAAMGVDPGASVDGAVTADAELRLRVQGGWSAAPAVSCGACTSASFDAGVVEVVLPAGSHSLSLG